MKINKLKIAKIIAMMSSTIFSTGKISLILRYSAVSWSLSQIKPSIALFTKPTMITTMGEPPLLTWTTSMRLNFPQRPNITLLNSKPQRSKQDFTTK